MTRLMKHRLFWPAVCLLALIALNTAVRPRFIKVTLRDGEHLTNVQVIRKPKQR